MHIEFTEEAVLNQIVLPPAIRNFRYYRQEIYTDDGYPIERGGLWLPPHINITEIEDLINAHCIRLGDNEEA